MTEVKHRAAVLGKPIAHSLSPVLHNTAYHHLGLTDWDYGRHEVDEPELASFLAGLDETWRGLSLTMPLKVVALQVADIVEPQTELVGAANTLIRSGGLWTATNTDIYGIVTALQEAMTEDLGWPAATSVADKPLKERSVVVLGGGATAASTLAALGSLGATEPKIFVRSVGRTGRLQRAAHQMGLHPKVLPLDKLEAELELDVLVSTLPPGAADSLAAPLAQKARGGALLLDVAYGSGQTVLGQQWVQAGGSAISGQRMLLHQAAEQVRLMTGLAAPVAAMDTALGQSPTG